MINTATATATAKAIRTQKAKGVMALSKAYYKVPSFEIFPVEQFSGMAMNPGEQSRFNFAVEPPYALVNKFVRPCPMVPRHGFVDSRPIRTIEEAEQIIAETIAAEPEAELLVMPFIDAKYSAIWTNGLLAIGTGNDGATAGTSARDIPIVGIPAVAGKSPDEWGWQTAKQNAGITESPYLEMLWQESGYTDAPYSNLFVQLRNGPELPSTVDYIPEKVTVKAIVEANGDLLEWETKVKTFAPGTIVYHPGGTLASHYSVHCALNRIPVLISRKPEIGETIIPETSAPKANYERIKAGFVLGATCKQTYKQAVRAMLTGCHSTAVWLGKRDDLLGFALGSCYRLLITAALGEMRHAPNRKRRPGRNEVYSAVWNSVLTLSIRTKYRKALDSFQNDPWPSSFGGNAWYLFSVNAGYIYNAILDGELKKALEYMNKAVNAAHNTGWGFNKFADQTEMNITANNPLSTLLLCAPALYEAIVAVEKQESELALFFKGKRHYELEEPDAETIAEIENDYEEEEPEPETVCPDCGNEYDCCASCHKCPEPEDVAKETNGVKTAQTKNPNLRVSKAGYAQFAINEDAKLMHIQFKTTAFATEYNVTDVQLTDADIVGLKKNMQAYIDANLCVSMSGSDKQYYKFFRGDITGKWYARPNSLSGLTGIFRLNADFTHAGVSF